MERIKSMAMTGNQSRQTKREVLLAEYSRAKLLTYANSFKELGDSLCLDRGTERNLVEKEERQQILAQKRLWEKQQVLGQNMTEMSHILAQVAAEAFHFYPLPQRLQKKVVHALRSEKIFVTDIYYIQKGEQAGDSSRDSLGITMYSEKAGGYTAGEVADMLSVLLDNCFSPAVTGPYDVNREEKSFVFVEEPAFMVFPGYAKAVKENETMSGDNYSIVESQKGQMTIFLSDGMGSGEKASGDSEKVLDLMEKLLEAGYPVSTAMNLVNSVLVASEEQNMSTLDACTLNLYSGMCQFYKAGAAATFLKSNSYVEQITANTLPLGIFYEMENEAVTRELIENDYIIMVTDGVTDALEAGGYEEMLQSYIEDLQDLSPSEMAGKILQFALRCSGGRVADDMTVVVLGIFRNR